MSDVSEAWFPGDELTQGFADQVISVLVEAGLAEQIGLTKENVGAIIQTFAKGEAFTNPTQFKGDVLFHFTYHRTVEDLTAAGNYGVVANVNATDEINAVTGGVEGGFTFTPHVVPEPPAEPPADPDTPPVDPNVTEPGVVASGDNVAIPSGGRLIGVSQPAGSDNPVDYYLVYNVFGTEVAYRVGGQDRLDELFPDFRALLRDQVEAYELVWQAGFDDQNILVVGEADEQVIGATESIQSVFERELRAQGLESLPSWLMNDPAAMNIILIAAQQGWSEGRTWKALQGTEGFTGRFPGLEDFMGRNQLEDVRSAVTAYVTEEQSMAAVLRASRGPDTNVDTQYLGELLSRGWTPQEAQLVLEGESRIKADPTAFHQFQQLMNLQGIQVGIEDFLEVFREKAPPEIREILNDTFRFSELAEQGLDIDATFAQFLGAGSSEGVVGPGGFTQAAQEAAQAILRFDMELDAQMFGVTREDVISAAFDQTSPGGRAPAEVNEALARFGRDRAQRARGLAGFQAFINQENRIQVSGLG